MRGICSAAPFRGNGRPAWSRRRIFALLVIVTTPAFADAQAAERQPAWSFTVSLGGYARGNGGAITSWLTRNGYGVPEPKHCGFDVFFRPLCDPAITYPQVSQTDHVGWTLGVERSVSSHFSVEVFGATEQSGTAVGRCDDLATPKDPRCTDRFMRVDFGGGSIASLGVVRAGHFHLGAGPALMLANWEMSPAHLAGAWVDATYDAGSLPLFAHAQYRIYQSTSLLPAHFVGFHPSTLYVGMGFTVRIDDSRY